MRTGELRHSVTSCETLHPDIGLDVEAEERGTEYPACPICFAQGLKGFLQFIAKLRGGGIDLPLQSMLAMMQGWPALALRGGESANAPPK